MKPNILLVGHFPKPIGGVSIHLMRLSYLLQSRASSLSFTGNAGKGVHRISSTSGLMQLLRGAKLLHYHTDERDWKKALLMSLWCLVRRQPMMITLHSLRIAETTPRPQLSAWRFILRHCKRVVCISSEMKQRLGQVLRVQPRAVVVPSFLPISQAEISRPLPARVASLREEFETLIVFNAFRAVAWNGERLYGEDLLLALATTFQNKNVNAGFVAVFATDEHDEVGKRIVGQLNALPNVAVLDGFGDYFAPILNIADVSLRLTRDDGGFSLTVLEAAEMGKVCVASDAVPRGDYPYTFRNGDAQDLIDVAENVLHYSRNQEADAKQRTVFDADEYIHQLYGDDYV